MTRRHRKAAGRVVRHKGRYENEAPSTSTCSEPAQEGGVRLQGTTAWERESGTRGCAEHGGAHVLLRGTPKDDGLQFRREEVVLAYEFRLCRIVDAPPGPANENLRADPSRIVDHTLRGRVYNESLELRRC